MSCAGIIGASHTTDSTVIDFSIISLNPNIKIMPIKIYDDSGYSDGLCGSDFADAVGFARINGADVFSNSWSRYNRIEYEPEVFERAIDSAFTYGRNGLGCPIIFSTGNHADNLILGHQINYPANFPNCFAVGAVQLDDKRWAYSDYGPELDIVAPSGNIYREDKDGYITSTGDVWSLDQLDTLGVIPNDHTCYINTHDYDCQFGGTSAAAPIVSGVASLILAKDPNLTSQQVYEILRFSAVTELETDTITAPDDEYGYGRVDAFRAILSLSHGDVNNSGGTNQPDISDMVYLVDFMFHGGPAPFPSELLADCDCSGDVDISDLTYLTDLMFNNGPQIQYPCFAY